MRKLILGIPAQVRGKSLTGLIIIFDAPIRPASITISYNLATRVALIMITSMTLRQLKLLLNPLRHSLTLILRVFIHSVAYRGLKIFTSLRLRFQDFQRKQQGFYKQGDVPHRSTFGVAPTSSVPVAGYNARNAPFGSSKVTGDQHLTRLYEPYLQQLSKEVAWSYHRLESSERLNKALQTPVFAKQQQVLSDSRPYFAVFTLILLGLVYFPRLRKSTSV